MAKICIIGDYDSICGFGALGIDTFTASEPHEISSAIENLAENDYAIILITENAAGKVTEKLDKYRVEPVPAIIPVPSVSGSGSLGMDYLRRAVEQAVGSAEMIFGEKQ